MGSRVFAAMAAGTALVAVVAVVSWVGASRISVELDRAYQQSVPGLEALAALDEGQMYLQAALWLLVNRRASPQEHVVAHETVLKRLAVIDETTTRFQALAGDEASRKLFQEWQSAFSAWRQTVELIQRTVAERDGMIAAGRSKDDPVVAARPISRAGTPSRTGSPPSRRPTPRSRRSRSGRWTTCTGAEPRAT